jgi:pullulanase
MLRSKNKDENSYKSGDGINMINWGGKRAHRKTFEYVRDLIALRKAHPAFRMGATTLIGKHLVFVDTDDDQFVIYQINDAPGEEWKNIMVVFNGSKDPRTIEFPEGNWKQVVNGRQVNQEGIGKAKQQRIGVPGREAAIFVLEG